MSTSIRDTVKNAAAETNELTGSLKDKTKNFGKSVKDTANNVLDKTKNAKNTVSKYVKHNPYKSVGLAFLAGLIYAKATDFTKQVNE